MKIIYVQHFLNEEGMNYFASTWFKSVEKAIKLQPGFISIKSWRSETDSECVNIVLKFVDDNTLQAWINTPAHDELVGLLDAYRVRDWLWAGVDIANENDPHEIIWNTVYKK